MKKPKISVILPTFNRASLISRAITSVLNQSLTDFELIIIDDDSTDNTEEIVKKYHDQRIVYKKRVLNSKITKENSRNDGLLIARGEYIAYIDSDNAWLKDHLKVLGGFLDDNKDFGAVYCDSLIFREGKKRVERSFDFKPGMKIPFPFVDTGEIMHRRECLKKVGLWGYYYPPKDDWWFFIKLTKAYQVKHLKIALCSYYSSNDLQNAGSFLKEAIRIYIENGKLTKTALNYLNYAIESCKKYSGRQQKKVKQIEEVAKTLLMFPDKKEILEIL